MEVKRGVKKALDFIVIRNDQKLKLEH